MPSSLTLADVANRISPMKKPKRWIAKAKIKAGAFTKKADAAGEGVHEFAEAKKEAGGKLGKEANLALTFEGIAHKKKRPAIYKS